MGELGNNQVEIIPSPITYKTIDKARDLNIGELQPNGSHY